MKVLFLLFFVYPAHGREIKFWNKLPNEIWVGSQGNGNNIALNNGGWKLGPNQNMSVTSPDNWAGRFWGRTWCDAATGRCATGDCGALQCQGKGGAPPMTQAVLTLTGGSGQDSYGISLVDGFNVPMSIERGDSPSSQYSCARSSCTNPDFLNQCPVTLQVRNQNGEIIGCNSACIDGLEFDLCYNNVAMFEQLCPEAYSLANSDSIYTCDANVNVHLMITIG